jgi:hypothetical protein
MAPPESSVPLPTTLLRVQKTLVVSQKQLGEILGCSARTIIRYYQKRGIFLPVGYEKLARACHPRDPVFAAELAAMNGKTLIDLGLERPAPPPEPPAPPPPAPSPVAPPPAPARPVPTHRQMVDSIVCVAAEATQLTPQAIRPGLMAAFERAAQLGMTAEEVVGALAAPKGASPTARPRAR